MSKVTFRSKQPYFQLSYMDVFKVGFITVPVVGGKPYKDNGNPNIDYAKCEELGIKDPDSVVIYMGYGLALVQAVALIFFALNVKEFDII